MAAHRVSIKFTSFLFCCYTLVSPHCIVRIEGVRMERENHQLDSGVSCSNGKGSLLKRWWYQIWITENERGCERCVGRDLGWSPRVSITDVGHTWGFRGYNFGMIVNHERKLTWKSHEIISYTNFVRRKNTSALWDESRGQMTAFEPSKDTGRIFSFLLNHSESFHCSLKRHWKTHSADWS